MTENAMVLFHSINNHDNIYDETIEYFRDQRMIPKYNERLNLTLGKGDVLFEELLSVFSPDLGSRAECLMDKGCLEPGYGYDCPYTIKVGGHQQWTLRTSYQDNERYLTIRIEHRDVSNLRKSEGKYQSFIYF